MNQYRIRIRERDLRKIPKRDRKVFWESIRERLVTLAGSKGSQHSHAERRAGRELR